MSEYQEHRTSFSPACFFFLPFMLCSHITKHKIIPAFVVDFFILFFQDMLMEVGYVVLDLLYIRRVPLNSSEIPTGK